MVEDRKVFDFTDEKFWNDIERYSESYMNYIKLRRDKIKKYTIISANDIKVIVSFFTEKDEEFDCIYHKKTTQDVEDLLKNKKAINLKGCYINNFDITEINGYEKYELKDFNASHSFWDGATSFHGAKFGKGDVSFDYAQFGKGDVSFDKAQFGDGNVSFWYTQFGEGDVSLFNAQFGKGDVSFRDTQIGDGNVSFDFVQFGKGNVRFENAQFGKGNVSFLGTEFSEGNVSFLGTQFGDGNVSFSNAQFGEGYVSFFNTQFDEGDVSFRYTQFGEGIVVFINAIADKIYFSSINMCSHIDLRFVKVSELIINDCIIEKTVMISGIDKKTKLSFKNTINLGQIHFSEKPSVIVSAVENSFTEDDSLNVVEELTDKQKLDQLILLKENYRALGEYDGEDLAYQTYMKYKTKFMKSGITKVFYKLFGEIGCYGTKPSNIVLWMFLSWISFAGLYFGITIESFSEPLKTFWDTLYYSGITFLTIGYGEISPVLEGGNVLRFLSVAEGFIGLFLMSYLTVAVVRKLLR